jgi:hypothetical protein
MSDVFISYKRRLRPQVERIATALRDLRIDVWFDAALEPGVSFSAEISHEVRNAGCVLVCWSNDAFPHGGDENGWVLGEASIGRKRGRLVTVMLEDTEFDPPWNTIHSERLVGFDPADFGADRAPWRGVLVAVGRLIERPGLADYDRAVAVGTAEALKGWVQSYPHDVLAESVWTKVEEIELATVRKRLAEERVKQPDPAAVQPVETPRAPERNYAPLPEIPIDPAGTPPAGVATAPVTRSAPPVTTRRPLSPPVAAAIACILSAIGSVGGAYLIGPVADMDAAFIGVSFAGPAATMILLSALLVVSGYLNFWRAAVLAVVGYVGFYVTVYSTEFLTRSAPSFGTEGADIAGGFAMGAVGAVILLFTLVMLSRNPNLPRAIPISLSGVLIAGVATALVTVSPYVTLRTGVSIIWTAPAWYLAMGAVLVWLLAE